MPFKNIVCWQASMIDKVMDTEALQTSDPIFLATHNPVLMYRQDGENGNPIEYDEQRLLHDFLAPQDYIFIAALGEAGTGKSHLVRWLAAKIPQTESRRVILVPKVGTNLKEIIRLILWDMEGKNFDRYRERLQKATNQLTDDQIKEKLLNQLAVSVGKNGNHRQESLSDEQQYLMEELPNLFYDPFFREIFLKPGGIVEQLTTHILGISDHVERMEGRREFEVTDLPLNLEHINKAGEKARDFYGFLVGNSEIQTETVTWINRNLDEAIGQVLDFSGEDLSNLLIEVREDLAERQIELVIIIEDFAKLQGIDRQLLEALLVRPNQPNRKQLCSMRAAIAVTKGYFNRLDETVRQRIEFRVNLDVETGNQNMVTEEHLNRFAAKYLNAIRLDEREIQHWYERNSKVEENDKLPCKCDDCQYATECHRGFGHFDGIGLYPFSPLAIRKMFARKSGTKFSPRTLIKDVLRHTLQNYGGYINKGTFPSTALLQHFGPSQMSALVLNELQRRDPSPDWQRRKVLLELWSDGETIGDFDSAVHDAFNLSKLNINEVAAVAEITTSKNSIASSLETSKEKLDSESKANQIPSELQNKLNHIDNWKNGAVLSQTMLNDLRELIYEAVTSNIDWNSRLLLKASFVASANSSSPFKKTSINFDRQFTNKGSAQIELLIPITSDKINDDAMAVQALLLYNYFENWLFPDGEKYFRVYQKQLEKWAEVILDQISKPTKSHTLWDPVPSLVEMLYIGAILVGEIKPNASYELIINSILTTPGERDLSSYSRPWKDLGEVFNRLRPKMVELLKARIPCPKGDVRTFQIVDGCRFIEALQDMAKNIFNRRPVPDDLLTTYQCIKDFSDKLDEMLEKALKAECENWSKWYQMVEEAFGKEIKVQETFIQIQLVMKLSREAGVFSGDFEKLNEVITKIKPPIVKKAAQTVSALDDSDLKAILMRLSTVDRKVLEPVNAFISQVQSFINKTLERVRSELDILNRQGGAEMERLQQGIDEDFEQMISLLKLLGGEVGAIGPN